VPQSRRDPKLYIVETEFLFGLRKNDKWHDHVMKILDLHKKGKIDELSSSASAFLEVGTVLQTHNIQPEQIEETLFLIKQKLTEANIEEIELNSDDIIRLYELLRRYDIEFFDAMQAAVAIGKNATLVTNDKIFAKIGLKTISFTELVRKTTRKEQTKI